MVKHAQNILITVSEFLEIVEAHPQSWKRPQIGPISVVVRQYSQNFLGISPHTPLGGLTAPPKPPAVLDLLRSWFASLTL